MGEFDLVKLHCVLVLTAVTRGCLLANSVA